MLLGGWCGETGLAISQQKRIRPQDILTMRRVIIQWLFLILLLGLPVVCPAAASTNTDIDWDAMVSRLGNWLQTNDSNEALEKLPEEFSSILQMLNSRTKAQEQIAGLQEIIRNAESLLQQKEIALTNMQQKIALLKLDPKQLGEIEKYNQSLKSEPASTMEWLRIKSTQYDITKDVVLMFVSFPLGMLAEAARHKWASKRRVSKKTESRSSA